MRLKPGMDIGMGDGGTGDVETKVKECTENSICPRHHMLENKALQQ